MASDPWGFALATGYPYRVPCSSMDSVPLAHQIAMVLLLVAMGFAWTWFIMRHRTTGLAGRVAIFFVWFFFLIASIAAIRVCWSVVYPHA